MARRAATILPTGFRQEDALDSAVSQDRENVADQLAEVLEQLGTVDQGSIKGILYRLPVPNGKYEWIRDVYPPFDMSDIMRTLKEDIGGGDYALRIMAEGKVRKTIHFAIMKDKPTSLIAPQRDDTMGGMLPMMFQMMMKQSEDAARQRADDMRDRQAASERMTTMLVGLGGIVAPLLLGGKEKTSELMMAIAAMQPKPADGSSMKDALETLTLAKGLFKDDNPAPTLDTDNLVSSGLKFAGPLVGSLAKAFSERRVPAERAQLTDHGAPPPLHFAPAAPQLGHVPAAPASNYPVLDVIREDVLYCFKRGHDPERTAELVYDAIENAGVSEEAINELVAAFALSSDWLADLASEGIDLRSRPEWAEQFLQAVIRLHAEIDDFENDRHGGDGGETDAQDHGGLSPSRIAADANSIAGGQPDE